MEVQEYTQQINSRSSEWGSAHTTTREWRAVCDLRGELGSWARVREVLIAGVTPVATEVDENDFFDAAAAHACSVGRKIHNDATVKPEDTFWSYTTKNRAFRFFSRVMRNSGMIELLTEWKGSETKSPDEKGNVETIRPANEFGEIPLIGIEKVECYWPCQLLRYVEAIRTGREEIIPLDDGEEEIFNIPWINFESIIKSGKDLRDVSLGVAERMIDLLKANGLDDSRVAAVILKGYSPGGPLKEHGQYDKVNRMWVDLIQRVPEGELRTLLRKGYVAKVREAGFIPSTI